MPAGDPRELAALLDAYIAGDVVAKKVLLDWLEEHDDPRLAVVRAEEIDWERLARAISRMARTGETWEWAPIHEVGRILFLIDCVRFGSDAPGHIREGVRQARRDWIEHLFPEIMLPGAS